MQPLSENCVAALMLVVRSERLIAQLGDARLRAPKEERTVAAEAHRRRARVAWKAIAAALLMLQM
jgi:hypothetical protein